MARYTSIYSSKTLRHFTPYLNRYIRRHHMQGKIATLYREWHYNELSKKLEQEFDEMAKTKGKAKAKQSFGDYVFAQVTIASEDKPIFKEWYNSNLADYERLFDNAIRSDWKVSTRYVEEQDAVICSFTMTDDEDINHHVTVSSWSDDCFEAFMLTYYKIFVMFDQKRLPTESSTGKWG
jgi:hypothetical protein